jgi:15-cis-phytoene synthase
MQDGSSHCAALVRTADRDRFIASLFAPADRRPGLHALYAFDAELARVRDLAHAALPGEIRLQWWSEAISRERDGEANANPVASALLAAIERHRLRPALLLDLVEARRFDLYEEPMRTLPELETYLQRTSSALISLAATILAGAECEQVAAPAGIALGLAQIFRAFPVHVARGQLFVPGDILERHDVHPHDLFAGRSPPGLKAALAEVRGAARRHLTTAGQALPAAPHEALPALLPLAVVRPWLDRAERGDPWAPAELSPWRRQWLIWRAARNPGRIAG